MAPPPSSTTTPPVPNQETLADSTIRTTMLSLKYFNVKQTILKTENECQRSFKRRNNIVQSRLTFLTTKILWPFDFLRKVDDIRYRNECQRSIKRRNNIVQSRLKFLTQKNNISVICTALSGVVAATSLPRMILPSPSPSPSPLLLLLLLLLLPLCLSKKETHA